MDSGHNKRDEFRLSLDYKILMDFHHRGISEFSVSKKSICLPFEKKSRFKYTMSYKTKDIIGAVLLLTEA